MQRTRCSEAQRIRLLHDADTREGLALHGARSITAADVVRVLQGFVAQHGAPVASSVTMALS